MTKTKIWNIVFIIFIVILIIPQTRKPVQVLLQKGMMFINKPAVKNKETSTKLTDYYWSLRDGNNSTYNLEEAKGKVVLINFWATWCPPCIAEMPSLQKLYDDYNDKIVFMLVTNEELSVINPFLKKHGYTFEIYRPENGYPEFFNITSIPRTFLIDKEGNVIIDENAAADWNSNTVRKTIDNLLD